MLKQLSIYAENKKGVMQNITGILKNEDINILGSVTNDSAEYGIVRMVVSEPDKAMEALIAAGYLCHVIEVIGVEVEDKTGNLNDLLLTLKDSNVSVDYLCYRQGDKESYQEVCRRVEESNVDAVLIAPNFRTETLALTDYLQTKKIAYAFVDFNMEEANALTYIGQDSYKSGYIAAKILMRNYQAGEGQELVLFLSNNKNSPAEIQMQRRMDGFMNFIAQEHENLVVHDVVLNKEDDEANRRTLEDFFAAHPKAVLGAVFNSRVYQVAGYLQETGHHLEGLVGYDLLPKNVEYLKSGEVNYLIGQRPGLQGYCGVKALCDHVVFKRPVTGVKYMPIDILMKENINFYFEFE